MSEDKVKIIGADKNVLDFLKRIRDVEQENEQLKEELINSVSKNLLIKSKEAYDEMCNSKNELIEQLKKELKEVKRLRKLEMELTQRLLINNRDQKAMWQKLKDWSFINRDD